MTNFCVASRRLIQFVTQTIYNVKSKEQEKEQKCQWHLEAVVPSSNVPMKFHTRNSEKILSARTKPIILDKSKLK